MRCDKRSYTFKEADALLTGIPVKANGQVPVRKYWCREHKAWHITSKPQMRRARNGR